MTMTHQQQDEEEVQSRFPFRLHTLLSNIEKAGLTHIMSWLPCGTRFKIHDTERFTTEIMPKIGRCTRYKSFLRQLSMYKFHRTMSGPLKGTYHHPYFRRNRIDECRGVLRGRAPVMNYQQDDRINSRSEIATADELENETAITIKATGAQFRTSYCNMAPRTALTDTDSDTSARSYSSVGTSINAPHSATVDSTIEFIPEEEYGIAPFDSFAPHLVDETFVEPDSPVHLSSGWARKERGTAELFSSSIPRKPTDGLPAGAVPISSLLEDIDSSLTLMMTCTPSPAEETVESWDLDWRASPTATEDIVDEIISTFTKC